MNYVGKSRWVTTASIAALLCGLIAVAYVSGQVVSTAPLNPSVQVNPPGYSTTSQTFWSQTATGAASAATVTQPATAGKVNFITGFEVTGAGATGASVITVTLASGGTTIGNYNVVVPAGATTTITPLIVEYPQPISGLGPGQNVVLTVASFGAGNTNSAVTMHGFTQ